MTEERVVLTDDEGNYYVLSREVLERARVTGAEKVRVREALEALCDTTGFTSEIISPNQTFPDQPRPVPGLRLRLAGILPHGTAPP